MEQRTAPSTGQLRQLTLQLVDAAESQGARLRAIGGLGVHLRVPDAPEPLRRSYEDIDMAAARRDRRAIEDAFAAFGLQPDKDFNAVQGSRRQIWWTADGATHVDVFLGDFEMCHKLSFDDRLDADHPALPAADLLLTKLQVVELNPKDVTDAAALLSSHELADEDGKGAINRSRLVDVLARDWGFYTTVTDNLEALPDALGRAASELVEPVRRTAEEIRALLEAAPKSRGFKLRARVGRRVRWYELPEESL